MKMNVRKVIGKIESWWEEWKSGLGTIAQVVKVTRKRTLGPTNERRGAQAVCVVETWSG